MRFHFSLLHWGDSHTFCNVSVLLRVKYGEVSDCFMYNVPSRLQVDVSDSIIITGTLFCLFIISCAAE